MNVFYVYEHWRTDRDECFYVGKGKGLRAYNMKKRNAHHMAIQEKVLREGFAIEVRIVASGLEEYEAYKLEVERISFWKNAKIDLANKTSGGEGVSGLDAWNKKPVFCINDGKIFNSGKEAAEYYGCSSTAISDVLRHKYRHVNGLVFVAANWNPEKLINMSEEDRIELMKQREINYALRRKKVAVNKSFGSILDGKDAKGRLATGPAKNSKPVFCLDDKRLFPSASEAARHYNVSKSAIIELCLKKNNRISVGGLKFAYLEEV